MELELRTGAPFWPIRDGLPYSYPFLNEDVRADVLIVGAGITGAAVARELACAGLDVVVLDRRDVASGSSAASTGLLLYDTDTSLAELTHIIGAQQAVRVYQLGARAIDDIESFCVSRSCRCEYARRPSLYVASRRPHVRALRKECELRERHGFAVRWLTAQDLEREYGLSFHGAIHAQGGAEVDPYRLTHELLDSARAAGARIFDRTTATALRPTSDGTLRIETDRRGVVSARSVVWATGYEAYRAAPDKARFASTWALVTEPVDAQTLWADRCLLWETARPYMYVRTTTDHRIIIGGEDEFCLDCHRSPRWFRTKTAKLLARARELFPNLTLDIAYAWAGTFSTTDDGLPFVGRSRTNPNVWLALGYGGNGITFSVMAARFLRHALTGVPDQDAAIFSRG